MVNRIETFLHCKSYGFLAAFAAIVAVVSWGVTQSRSDACFVSGYKELQWYHAVGAIAGLAVGVGAVFAVASKLKDLTPILLYVAGVCIAVSGIVIGYGAYFVFPRPCPSGSFISIDLVTGGNIFDAKDGPMISVFVLDILACLLLLSCAAAVAHRAK